MLGKHSIFTSDGIVCLYVNDTDICVTYVVIIIRGASCQYSQNANLCSSQASDELPWKCFHACIIPGIR